jgi:hypothetical protein
MGSCVTASVWQPPHGSGRRHPTGSAHHGRAGCFDLEVGQSMERRHGSGPILSDLRTAAEVEHIAVDQLPIHWHRRCGVGQPGRDPLIDGHFPVFEHRRRDRRARPDRGRVAGAGKYRRSPLAMCISPAEPMWSTWLLPTRGSGSASGEIGDKRRPEHVQRQSTEIQCATVEFLQR